MSPSQQPETQYVKERGDKVVTLDQRLDNFETRIERLERLVIWIGVGAITGSTIGPIIGQLLGIH